jgi:hypothetical protein
MLTTLPFLTSYDPPGSSEGKLDPLGLYQIADQLAVQLVPAVRERMQRIRFLTAMSVGALVTENLPDNPINRDASPYLVWEWHVVESLVRNIGDELELLGVPGSLVARREIGQHGYLDARSYLKTPRIFGFNGVYKRLATHLGLVDVHLGPGPNAERLVDMWARGFGLSGLSEAKAKISRWSTAVKRGLAEKPPRTKTTWGSAEWAELAEAFAPNRCGAREKRYLRELLFAEGDRRLGALPAIWHLLSQYTNPNVEEEPLHNLLERRAPSYSPLTRAIRAYESFARSLHDAFDLLRAEAAAAAQSGTLGFDVPKIAHNSDFKKSVGNLHKRFEAAHNALDEVSLTSVSLKNLFDERFRAFAEPMDAATCAIALCSQHETVQRAKSADGKRPWFDRLGQNHIYIRHAYRIAKREIQPNRYVHDYRTKPIRRFYFDLS